MKCPLCAKETASDSVFCAVCGGKIPRCPSCGAVLYERSRFCENDGTLLPEELFAGLPPAPAMDPAPPPAGMEAAQPPKKKTGHGLLAAVIVVLLLAAAAGGYFFLQGGFRFGEEDAYVPASLRGDRWDEPEEEPEDKPADEPGNEPADTTADDSAGVPANEPAEGTAHASGTAPVSMEAVVSVDASSYLSQADFNLYHTPGRTLDGDLSTAWVEGADGDGIGESITFTFDGAYLVSGMRIYAGYQKSEDLYDKNARPAVLTVRFSDGGEQTVLLQDVNGLQDIAFETPAETGSVTLVIASVYPGSKYEDTVISEVFFY